MEYTTERINETFAKDVEQGLNSNPKHLSSKYFYDAAGDKLFQKIMVMPEYYLTKCELEIFERQKSELFNSINPGGNFDLVEFGAGDGSKTKVLLEYLIAQQADFEYFPIDISVNAIGSLEADLKTSFPDLRVTGLNEEYFTALCNLNEMDDSPKVILFLGSNIGNFTTEGAISFFRSLYDVMSPRDQILCGFDLKKNPRTILKAYNDEAGITKEFNLNLLHRINRELGANFKVENFEHYPNYDPFSGECRSYLMSTVDQDVYIGALDKSFHFDHSEPIHTEISHKYSLKEIDALATQSGFQVKRNFTDSREYFVDALWVKE